MREASERAEQYKKLAEEYRARSENNKGFFQRRKFRTGNSGKDTEIIRFRKAFAENAEYSEEQRDFLTMCFGDPDPKKRLTYEEIVLIASPKLSVGQMQTLKDKILLER